ncbi:helix-turn-helix domain-containing protein [Oricola thermophila]|uniref:Helix-turn-helix domain-containing protein n=2 Tax=Oricola thermophila TaxID=2742145 RepID=A0A6N1VHT4_9HYPH|nr:helix-turn-helix domain-containing protein [Oricola thermophila]
MSPFNVELIGFFEGTEGDERDLHERFADFHHRGEWFKKEGDLARWCDGIAGRGLNNSAIVHLRKYLKAKRGRLTSLANGIGVRPGTISQWDRIPADRVFAVSRLTGIPIEELRPDLVNACDDGRAA